MSTEARITGTGRRVVRALIALLASVALFGAAAARADVVTDWAAVLEESTLRVPDPTLPIRAAAIMQLAVFEAVNAIVGGYEPYLGSVSAPAGASPEAAAIAAAHRVLVALLPDQTESLNASPDFSNPPDWRDTVGRPRRVRGRFGHRDTAAKGGWCA
jgi:hypothetical protein